MVVESIPIEMFAGLFLMIFENIIKIAIISPHFHLKKIVRICSIKHS